LKMPASVVSDDLNGEVLNVHLLDVAAPELMCFRTPLFSTSTTFRLMVIISKNNKFAACR
jgi:hypothetical protein